MGQEGSGERRVAAILKADIVGSTRTLGRDGIGVVVRHRARLAAVVAAAVESAPAPDRSLVLDEGDAAVVALPSAVDALDIGAAVLTATASDEFDVRVGLTIGEVDAAGTPDARPDDRAMARVESVQSRGKVGCVTLDALARRALLDRPGLRLEPLPDADLHCVAGFEPATQVRTELRVAMLTEIRGGAVPTSAAAAAIREGGGDLRGPHGNGSFALFDSAGTAVEAAAEIHRRMGAARLERAEAAAATVALGVGEVATSGEDRFGRPVVESARLLALADDATAVTADVLDLAGGGVSGSVSTVATTVLRNFDDPVTVHRIAPPPALDPSIGAVVDGVGVMAPLFSSASRGVDPAGPVDQIDLFRGVASTLGALAARRPLVLVVDDVQWADADTVNLLHHLLASPTCRRVLLIATCRSDHLRPDHPVRRLLASSTTRHPTIHRRLHRLSQDEVVELLESRADRRLEGAERTFAGAVTRATGGVPLFVEELLVRLNATGALVREGGWHLSVDVDEIPLPESLVDLMGHRIERLGSSAGPVLAAAAVIGSTFDSDLVAAVTGRPIDEVIDAIDGAADLGLVRRDPDGGSHRFGDEITRAAALRRVGAGRRARLHAEIARRLEATEPDAVDALAHHWEHADGRESMRRAAHHLRRAAERDMAATAWESAIERLRRVRRLHERLGDDDDTVLGPLHYQLGSCLRMIGDEAHRPDLLVAAECARRAGDADLLARSVLAMMRPGAWYPEAGIVDGDISAMCEDTLLVIGPEDPLRPRVLATLATNLSYDPDVERRWSLVREAQELAARFEDPRLVGAASAAELVACQEPDQVERRWELAQEVHRIGRATGDRELAFTGGFFMMLEHLARGEIAVVESISATLTDLADTMGGYCPQFLAAHVGTLLAVARCDPDARDVIEAERARFEHQPVDTLGISVIQQAGIAMAEGNLSEMLLPFAQAVDKYREIDEWTKKWNFAFAKAHLDAGDLDDAVAMVEAYPDPDFDRYWLASLCQLGQLGLALGDADYCRRVLRDLEPYRNRFALVGVGAATIGQVSTALGQAALGLDDLDAAEAYFREALTQAEAAGFPYFATLARRLLATTLLRRDPADDGAAALVDHVLEVALARGFRIEAAEAEELRSIR